MSFCFSFQERVFLNISNYVFTVIFVAEMTVKVWFRVLYFFFGKSIHFIKQFRNMACVKGGGPWFLLREAQLSKEHMECFGWGAGLCVPHWHSGLSGLPRRKPNLRHPKGSSPAANSAATEVSQQKVKTCLSEAQTINEIPIHGHCSS